MTTIQLRTAKEKVYFLTEDGFQKGFIKRSIVVSEKENIVDIKYYVVSDNDNDVFGGHERRPNEIFDTYEQMIDYYSKRGVMKQ